jgi:hypothetical protein
MLSHVLLLKALNIILTAPSICHWCPHQDGIASPKLGQYVAVSCWRLLTIIKHGQIVVMVLSTPSMVVKAKSSSSQTLHFAVRAFIAITLKAHR